MNKSKQGVPPSGSGCQPSASAADASSQSGIPNAYAVGYDPRTDGFDHARLTRVMGKLNLLVSQITADLTYGVWNPDYCRSDAAERAQDCFDEIRHFLAHYSRQAAQAIEARQGGDGTAPSQDESAVRQDAPGDGQ